MKKILPVLCCLYLSLQLFGCQSEEKVLTPKEMVVGYLSNLAKGNIEKAASISGETYHENEFGDSSFSNEDMQDLMFTNLEYDIKDEKYDKQKERATVNVEISNTNYLQLFEEARVMVANDPKAATLNEEQMNAEIMKQAKQLLKEKQPKTQRVTVLFEKQKDGTYKMTDNNASFHLAITGQSLE